MKLSATLFLLLAVAAAGHAQRPRTMDAEPTSSPKPAPAPSSVKAKYEGGVFGYTKTMEGTLIFDDANNQLRFKDKDSPKELHIPYDAIASAFADTQKRQPKAASVAGAVPSIYSLPAHFIKTKVRYLTLQFSDPDTHVSGVTSFKLENKELLASVLTTLANKAGMTQRGDIFVKKTDTSKVGP
jgi:hypothetical protein